MNLITLANAFTRTVLHAPDFLTKRHNLPQPFVCECKGSSWDWFDVMKYTHLLFFRNLCIYISLFRRTASWRWTWHVHVIDKRNNNLSKGGAIRICYVTVGMWMRLALKCVTKERTRALKTEMIVLCNAWIIPLWFSKKSPEEVKSSCGSYSFTRNLSLYT